MLRWRYIATPTPEISSLVDKTAGEHQVDPKLVHAIIQVESGYNPRALSRKGARGLMQLIPATAARFGVRNSYNPEQNIEGGVTYLKYLLDLFGGNVPLSVAAYNAGENAVLKKGGIPAYAETVNYVQRVTGLYNPGPQVSPQVQAFSEPKDAPIFRLVDQRGVVHYTNGDGL
jgi:soluble lytic murein transglycosylase-like protein